MTKCGAAFFAKNQGLIKNLVFDGFSNVDNSYEPADVAVVAVENYGTISNIVVKNIDLMAERATVAGAVATNMGTVENVTVDKALFAGKYVGGVIGTNSGMLSNAIVSNAVADGVYAGGAIAQSSGTVEKVSVFNTDIQGMCLGGIVGVVAGGSIYHSTSAAVLDTRNCEPEQGKQPYMGGLVGLADGVYIQNSYATSNIDNYRYNSIMSPVMGGLIGCNEAVSTLQVKSSVAPWGDDMPINLHFAPIAGKANLNSHYRVSDLITYAKQYVAANNNLVWVGVASQINNSESANVSYLYESGMKRTDVEWDAKYFNSDNMVQGYHMVLPKHCPTTYQVKTTAKYTSAVVAEADRVEGDITYLDMTASKAIDNTIFFPIDAESVVDEFYNLPNVCRNGNTVKNLQVVDGKDFICTVALTAENIDFERKNIAGWTTLCLPFDITQDMLPADVVIEEVVKIDAEKGKIYTQTTSAVEAGVPFLLYCEDEDVAVSLQNYNKQIATAPAEKTGALHGTFATTDVEADYFVLDKSGQCFVKTSGSQVAAFNAYLLDERLAGFESIEVDRNPTTVVENIDVDTNAEQVIYDLHGRRVVEVTASGVYVVNGKKVFVKR